MAVLGETYAVVKHLNAIDYVVFVSMLAVSALIGIYYACTGGNQKTASEFLMANRQMGVLPVALSLLASFLSANTLLGIPSEMYSYGTQYLMIIPSFVLVMIVSGHLFLPIFYKMRLTSAYEYLEKRFHRYNRLAATVSVIMQMSMYMGIVLYAPSLALNAVTGLSWTMSILLLGIVCTFYTTIGGMKAVMWTDVFQTLIMLFGMLAIVVVGFIEIGGWQNMWDAIERGNRVEFFNFDPNPLTRHTFWSLMFGGSFVWMVAYGINQSQVQRYCATQSMRKAQIALWLNLPGMAVVYTICALTGLLAYAYYEKCDPLTVKTKITKSDQILPLFVVDVCSKIPGFAGLFIATVFSGAMSTVSSGVNALAAITLEDIVKPYLLGCFCKNIANNGLSEESAAIVSKVLALSYGLLAIALAFLASMMGNVLQAAMGLFGMIGGPILGVFFLGVLFKGANWKGALAGHLLGATMSLWIGFGGYIYKYPSPRAPMFVSECPANFTGNLTSEYLLYKIMEKETMMREDYEGLSIYRMSYLWQGAFAVLCTMVFGLIISYITGGSDEYVNPHLMFTFPGRRLSTKLAERLGINRSSLCANPGAYDQMGLSTASMLTSKADSGCSSTEEYAMKA